MPTYAPLFHIASFLLYSETMTRALLAYFGFLMVHFLGLFFPSIVGCFFLTGALAAAPTACFFRRHYFNLVEIFRGLLQFGWEQLESAADFTAGGGADDVVARKGKASTRSHQEYSHTHPRCPAFLKMFNSCILVLLSLSFSFYCVFDDDIRRLAVKWHECHIPSAETKLIMITNKPVSYFFLPDGSAKRDEGAWHLLCHTLIILPMPWRRPYLWLIFLTFILLGALERICESWCFPSDNTTQKLSCCRFLCTVHYNKCYVRGGVSQKLTIRHNMDTKCWMWRYILFFTWIIVMLLLKLRLNEEN